MKVNIEKFENTLIKNWTEFIEIREFLTYARTLAINYLLLSESSKVTKLSFSRFELSTEGFIVRFTDATAKTPRTWSPSTNGDDDRRGQWCRQDNDDW